MSFGDLINKGKAKFKNLDEKKKEKVGKGNEKSLAENNNCFIQIFTLHLLNLKFLHLPS